MHVLIALCLSVLVAYAFRKHQKPDPLGYTRFVAAAVGSLWPYVDRPLGWLLGTQFSTLYEGTFTWSFILAPFVAWGLALGLSYCYKGYEPESPYVSRRFFVPVMAGLGLTLVLAVFSEKGAAIFAPFWFGQVSFSIVHSFDVGLLVATIVLTLLMLFMGKFRTLLARGILIVLFLYMGVVGTFKLKAIQMGKAYANAIEAPVEKIHTLPQALSPFYWHVVVETTDQRLHSTKVSLKRANPLVITPKTNAIRRAKAVYMPIHKAVWHIYSRFGRRNATFAEKAWQGGFKGALSKYGHLAVLRKKAPYKGVPCAWFRDLTQEGRTKQYVMCQSVQQGGTSQKTKWLAYAASHFIEQKPRGNQVNSNQAAGEALLLLDTM